MKRIILSLFVSMLTAFSVFAASPPEPYGPVPSDRQLKWHELEMYAFIHFTVNTFTDREWGLGSESENIFNPTEFNADKIVSALKDGGLRGVVLTCKHHDGFCLWPSQYTEHSVKNSPWKNGKGDMVKEISDACKKHGLKFGTYLSPWDRNHKDYARPEYITYYRNQLRELLTNYGPIFEMWFDGANGGDGYYGGANEKRKIDNRTYYDWDNTWKIVRELQPDACMFSDGGPDVRWVGNESGFAGETCWATMNRDGLLPGHADPKLLNIGERPGTHWLPAEVDVSIRPGWFYHANQDEKVKSVAHLLKIYYESVGRGANLILNVPPDRRGLVHEIDAKALREWKRIIDATFAIDLAKGAIATASNTRGKDKQFSPGNLTDNRKDTYWATDDNITTPELILDLGKKVTLNVIQIREYLPLGQRVDSFAVDYWNNDKWEEFASATSIGNKRLLRTRYITTSKVRVRITKAAACPAISEIGLFASPAQLSNPIIKRDKTGEVTIACDFVGPWIRYTTDGSEPTENSQLFEKSFPLPGGGMVKARAFLLDQKLQSDVMTETFNKMKGK
ncbi:MAG: alpha-L-fucosidase [Kiritimatiellae bacterium]|nr:alpha-L-fucosidase [Kiritimatiellia bacterium]MDD5519406.1 alpha-L-fucosidase [Kiritimatiellia bacterium]